MITNIMELADAYAEAYRWQTIAGYKQARAALLAEVERVSKDKERGNFVRENIELLPYKDHGMGPEYDLSDAAIDAAMKGKS
ncbi:MAG: hypothetical protein WC829_09935 [Hyphomicrobium sp.]|jgi:hypothetical protein